LPRIGGNSIVGALTVSGNIAPGGGNPKENNATEIEGNTVKGLTTCATNNPAPINDGPQEHLHRGANGRTAGFPSLAYAARPRHGRSFAQLTIPASTPDTTAW